uniref:uncharacterized protein LOC120325432 n=1 Tax=Styela clava TaxID=7725 RepID=UPI001939C4D7|nr:uncharacterized protein LOC120325432 [Styela clava]
MSDIPRIGFLPRITSREDGPSVRTTFHPVGDYVSKGDIQELLENVADLNKRVSGLENTNWEQKEEILGLKTELKRYVKSNEQLLRKLEKTLAENRDMKKCFQMLLQIAETEPGLYKYKSYFEKFTYHEDLEEKLLQSGVQKTNWWKILALGLAGGFIGVAATVGFVPMFIVGAAIGGGAGYLHEEYRLRNEKKSE